MEETERRPRVDLFEVVVVLVAAVIVGMLAAHWAGFY
jgi:hypothetical protein